MYKYVDHLLSLLPQETEEIFHALRAADHFVGHPVIESPVVHGDRGNFSPSANTVFIAAQVIICL